MRPLLLLLLLLAAAQALEPEAADPAVLRQVMARRLREPSYGLQDLLAWQRRSYPPAVVTSGFYDPRGVSRYRSEPGLHLGYDIAMPAGASVLAAWTGRVSAVIPWAPGEWGVAVEHPDGTRATYGHVVPSVAPGQAVEPGTSLGTVAIDHLDVKLRDASDRPVDFGASTGPSRERLLAEWWLDRLASAEARSRRQEARRALAALEVRARHRERADALGLFTPAERTRLETRLRQAQAALKPPEPTASPLGEVRARRAGLTWSDVCALAREWAKEHPELRRAPRPRGVEGARRKPLGSWR